MTDIEPSLHVTISTPIFTDQNGNDTTATTDYNTGLNEGGINFNLTRSRSTPHSAGTITPINNKNVISTSIVGESGPEIFSRNRRKNKLSSNNKNGTNSNNNNNNNNTNNNGDDFFAHRTCLRDALSRIYKQFVTNGDCAVSIDDANKISLRLDRKKPAPPDFENHNVPVLIIDLSQFIDNRWDIALQYTVSQINGVNNIKRIGMCLCLCFVFIFVFDYPCTKQRRKSSENSVYFSVFFCFYFILFKHQKMFLVFSVFCFSVFFYLADLLNADIEVIRECIRQLLYYECITLIDTFQFSNRYVVTKDITRLNTDMELRDACLEFVSNYQSPSMGPLMHGNGNGNGNGNASVTVSQDRLITQNSKPQTLFANQNQNHNQKQKHIQIQTQTQGQTYSQMNKMLSTPSGADTMDQLPATNASPSPLTTGGTFGYAVPSSHPHSHAQFNAHRLGSFGSQGSQSSLSASPGFGIGASAGGVGNDNVSSEDLFLGNLSSPPIPGNSGSGYGSAVSIKVTLNDIILSEIYDLYSKLNRNKTVKDLFIESNWKNHSIRGKINIHKFIMFGCINKLIRRIHGYPIYIGKDKMNYMSGNFGLNRIVSGTASGSVSTSTNVSEKGIARRNSIPKNNSFPNALSLVRSSETGSSSSMSSNASVSSNDNINTINRNRTTNGNSINININSNLLLDANQRPSKKNSPSINFLRNGSFGSVASITSNGNNNNNNDNNGNNDNNNQTGSGDLHPKNEIIRKVSLMSNISDDGSFPDLSEMMSNDNLNIELWNEHGHSHSIPFEMKKRKSQTRVAVHSSTNIFSKSNTSTYTNTHPNTYPNTNTNTNASTITNNTSIGTTNDSTLVTTPDTTSTVLTLGTRTATAAGTATATATATAASTTTATTTAAASSGSSSGSKRSTATTRTTTTTRRRNDSHRSTPSTPAGKSSESKRRKKFENSNSNSKSKSRRQRNTSARDSYESISMVARPSPLSLQHAYSSSPMRKASDSVNSMHSMNSMNSINSINSGQSINLNFNLNLNLNDNSPKTPIPISSTPKRKAIKISKDDSGLSKDWISRSDASILFGLKAQSYSRIDSKYRRRNKQATRQMRLRMIKQTLLELCDGQHCFDDICCQLSLSLKTVMYLLKDSEHVVLFK